MSLGTSPTAPSLLIPPNPAFSPADSAPRGGILINVQRSSDSFAHGLTLGIPSPSATEIPSPSKSYFSFGHARRTSESGSATGPTSPLVPIATNVPSSSSSASPIAPPPQPQSPASAAASAKALKIRFAPLPDPRRPRSLSTGRNVMWKPVLAEDGSERRNLELQGHVLEGSAVDDEEQEDDDEGEEFDPDEGEDDEGGGKRGRSWSKTMGSSWKGTKKLLTGKNPIKDKEKDKLEVVDPAAYGSGAPLKKSVSTGGFIGASPFRWTSETERRRSMQGPPPATVSSLLSSRRDDFLAPSSSSPGHRRNSSVENPALSSSLGTSPAPVRMLNGRVYGSRRASEAAEREKQLREQNEPAFVEWGNQASVGSNAAKPTTTRGGFMEDDDDGGGMSWVKRRREERQRREAEERARQVREEAAAAAASTSNEEGEAGNGLSSSQSSASSLELGQRKALSITTNPTTPAIPSSELPPAPLIQVSSPIVSPSDSPSQPSGLSKSMSSPPIRNQEHVVQAMRIPSGGDREREAQSKRGQRDVFDDDVSPTRRNQTTDDEEEEDDEEDDGDFEDDEEEEVDIRTTSSAAGVEVVSRHKD